jgi:hypothetical protein
MSNKTPTPILVDTNTLSKMVTDILALVDAPATKKSACLNKIAARIAGPRRNWGFVTGRRNTIYAPGVSPTLDVVDQASPPFYTEKIWRGCTKALSERTGEPFEKTVTGGLALAMSRSSAAVPTASSRPMSRCATTWFTIVPISWNSS